MGLKSDFEAFTLVTWHTRLKAHYWHFLFSAQRETAYFRVTSRTVCL